MDDFFALYDTLLNNMRGESALARVAHAECGAHFAFAEAEASLGIAMAGDMDSVAPRRPAGLAGLTLREAAECAKSWNLREASMGVAAMNAYFNTTARINELGCAEPFENHAVRGLSFDGAVVGIIGHMHLTDEVHEKAARVYTLERRPQPGDYPDSACELILPQCDYVFISGSTLMNKTLPRLLRLAQGAYTVLLGPSVPLCPALLEHGIDRLSGMAVTDNAAMREHVCQALPRSPYAMGTPFLISK